jgi:hypothetical protein
MAASDSISINSSASADFSFDLCALRFRFVACQPLHFPAGESANWLRGQFGKVLRQQFPEIYHSVFAPSASDVPSGLRDLPRPFVLRAAHLDGARFQPGENFEVGLNIFDLREHLRTPITTAVRSAVPAQYVATRTEPVSLSLASPPRDVNKLRVRFITPTELKGIDTPEFGALFSRIRDRVSTLRALYGSGQLPIDFRSMGERANCVRMTRCELNQVDAQRTSRRTGQRHSLGGFIGIAEYAGCLREFVPYLQAARWTGVGRQTVWGKGEIACEEI